MASVGAPQDSLERTKVRNLTLLQARQVKRSVGQWSKQLARCQLQLATTRFASIRKQCRRTLLGSPHVNHVLQRSVGVYA
jgi:hypothetical protein